MKVITANGDQIFFMRAFIFYMEEVLFAVSGLGKVLLSTVNVVLPSLINLIFYLINNTRIYSFKVFTG